MGCFYQNVEYMIHPHTHFFVVLFICSWLADDKKQVVDQKWYQDFVSDEQLDHDMLFELLAAANHMGIKPLLDLTSLKVTFQMMDRSEDDVSISGMVFEGIKYAIKIPSKSDAPCLVFDETNSPRLHRCSCCLS